MGALQDKTAIITGATSGIGYAAARLFAREGARLVVTARGSDRLDSLVREIESEGGVAIAVAGDVRDATHARTCVDTAVARFGGLDIGFNNAGASGAMGPVVDLEESAWRETVETNLTGAFLGAKYQSAAMLERGSGSLVFTSSFVGTEVGFPGMAAYAAAKAGLTGLAQVIAAELGPRGIRANVLLPGGTDTPSNVVNVPGATPETRVFIKGLHALKRLGQPQEIAAAALFLASDASSFMTGAAMLVDGGVSITRS